MEEKKVLRRCFWVWQFEQEERWLNRMAQEGWVLKNFTLPNRFTFVPCQPGEYVVRLAWRRNEPDCQAFLEELGAQEICSFSRWSYYRRRADLGDFELLGDLDAKIHHLDSIARTLSAVFLVNLAYALFSALFRFPIGVLNLLAACVLGYALGRIHGKAEDLKQERLLHE